MRVYIPWIGKLGVNVCSFTYFRIFLKANYFLNVFLFALHLDCI